MENHIQTMADHWPKIFIFVVFLTSARINGQSVSAVKVTFIDNAVAKGAVCLDGSPGAYFYDKGFGEGVDNWIVYLQGGGWCGSAQDCLSRTKTDLGSTKNVKSAFFGSVISPSKDINPDFYNWNRVQIQYCDGASYMADVEAVDPATNLHLRGARIFRATIEELLAKGMRNASKAILMGNSAGGLATVLNCDRFQTFLPNASSVKCVADSGFFIRAKDLPGVEKREGTYAKVTAFHELDRVLPTSCTSRMNSSLCLFPENVVGDIQTPLFLLNSDFDAYQIAMNLKPRAGDEAGWQTCVWNLPSCTANQLQVMKDFRAAFLQTLKELRDNPTRGLFINSCHIHDLIYKRKNWCETPILENKTIAMAVGDWFYDRNSVRLIDTQNDSPIDCGL